MTKKQPNSKTRIIGLTGSIGMGKSTAAKILKTFGLPVFNADKAVHALLKPNGRAAKPVARIFPETVKRGAINRRILSQIVFSDKEKLKRLENILHPMVAKDERDFIAKAKKSGKKEVVLEIPLLFETQAEKRCDITICVTAPKAIQKKRVLQRSGMTDVKLRHILKNQMPDKEKRQRADYIISTGISVEDTKKQLKTIWRKIQKERQQCAK